MFTAGLVYCLRVVHFLCAGQYQHHFPRFFWFVWVTLCDILQHSESTAETTEGNYTYLEDIRPYFNFGVADIDINGNLNFTIINTDNEVSCDTLRFHEMAEIKSRSGSRRGANDAQHAREYER